MKTRIVLLAAVLLMVSVISCGEKREANPKIDTDAAAKVLATVNDVPITENDVKQILKRIPSGMGAIHQGTDQNALQTLVRDELIYQKGVELGLDKNQAYRLKLAEAEAQLRALKRQEMSALYLRQLRSNANVTDAEAQAYFEKNAKKLQTTFNVWHIFYKGNEAQIGKDLEDLKKGAPFEKVAARQFPNLPKEMKTPWDLGYMHWSQIPEPWQEVLDRLAPGQVSEVIKGPRDRYWVIKLVNKTVDPRITFETEKGKIVEQLSQRKADALYNSMLAEMKEKAKIVYPK